MFCSYELTVGLTQLIHGSSFVVTHDDLELVRVLATDNTEGMQN
jgi:hypothetical protein